MKKNAVQPLGCMAFFSTENSKMLQKNFYTD